MPPRVPLRLLLYACLCLPFAGCGDPPPAADPALKAKPHHAIKGHDAVVWQVAFSPDGRHLASCSVDRTVKLWRMPEAVLAQTLTHPEGVTALAFSPDGQRLASGSYDRVVRVWRLPDGALEKELKGHEGTVWSVAFSPDGARLATAGYDNTVILWRLET